MVYAVVNSLKRVVKSAQEPVVEVVSKVSVDAGRAAEIGVPASEEDLQPYDIHTADEAFFASTPWSILPVTRVDRQAIGDGMPGKVTGRLLDAWTELVGVDVRAEAEKLASEAEQLAAAS